MKTHTKVVSQISKLIIAALLPLIMSGCSSSKKITSITRESAEEYREAQSHKPKHLMDWQDRMYKEALSWLGTPYKYAGAEKGVGADCSGFVLRVYEATEGWMLPRQSAKQAEYCKRIKAEDVLTGDLVFFATGKDLSKVSHVGIMLDDTSFVHASSSKGVVISKINTPYYSKRLLMYGRLPQVVKVKR